MFPNISGDIARFAESEPPTLRSFIRALLSPGFHAIIVYRFFRFLYRHKIPSQPLRFFVERFIEITTGISIPASCQIGPGLRIHHFGGIIFHPSVRIGRHCTLYHGVTLGDRGGYGGAPTLGDNIVVGAGAKVLGAVTIGDNCLIGANSVVDTDVPSDTTAVGNPSTFKKRRVGSSSKSPAIEMIPVEDQKGC
jgi:serine O-acetyltransferase